MHRTERWMQYMCCLPSVRRGTDSNVRMPQST
eukprot:CAMPEP_0204605370 /NCGR_PEP_ID=MMETSP0661-20131031/58441_1 /ASSEMBLY_ACC=CAM_ASM_000606 /TAXON_ID=109239 /ORGANISM="Alexandrium margalefi, Strain AMGDE01CS-322" /LENGTH=31 /DNA_ID= /DNA_START= /DNA_END= /DNA_ORIENTATION=